jgi:hypothetical protein
VNRVRADLFKSGNLGIPGTSNKKRDYRTSCNPLFYPHKKGKRLIATLFELRPIMIARGIRPVAGIAIQSIIF